MKQLNVRVPDDLHAQLVSLAAEDQRSLNKEILWIIDQYIVARATR
jgi:predicted HicB family RNase H-like nuclease